MRTRIVLVLLALVVALSLAIARQFALGAHAMSASDEALARGDISAAIDEARAAAEARAPGSPYPQRGYERLMTLARDAEHAGHVSDCARAWRAVQSAALSTRVFEDDAALREANVQLARIGAREHGDISEPAATREAELQAELARDERPSPYAYAALGAGGILFYLGIASLLTSAARRWPKAWSFALAILGAALAALGCLGA